MVRYSRSSPNILRRSFLRTLPGPVMRIDDVVAELELDVLELAVLEVLEQLLFDRFGNGVLLGRAEPAVTPAGRTAHVCR